MGGGAADRRPWPIDKELTPATSSAAATTVILVVKRYLFTRENLSCIIPVRCSVPEGGWLCFGLPRLRGASNARLRRSRNSGTFKQHRDAHAAADAQSRETAPRISFFHLI